MKETRMFIQQVLAVVNQIPFGKVATYGQIAGLVGHPKNARQVGRVLRLAPQYGKFPCHRVVTANGRLVPGWIDQRPMLVSEEVPFSNRDHVKIQQCQWRPKPGTVSLAFPGK
jgi:methylated-DNA-protein-cysteine methyltransferase-like protein